MPTLRISDLHSYVFCIFMGVEDENRVIDAESLDFLGTGFFISKNGDAVTAGHVLPPLTELAEDQHLYAIVIFDGSEKICRIIMAAHFENADLAVFRIQTEMEKNPYFPLDFVDIRSGDDVIAFGVTEHSQYSKGKELRTLKGHVSLNPDVGIVELSFPVPRGMSGGPVLMGSKCVGYLLGSIDSEQVIDQTEEIIELTNEKEKIKIIESRKTISYGIFAPFYRLRGKKIEVFEDRTLQELIDHRNAL